MKKINFFCKSKRELISSLLLLLFVSATLNAQEEIEKDLKADSVVIIKEYDATISDAYRISDKPSEFEVDVKFPDVDFTLIKKQIPVKFDVLPIESAKMKGEPLVKLYKSYVRLGFGSNLSTLADYHINNTRSRKQSIGMHIHHLGTQGKISGVGHPGFSTSGIDLYGKKFLPKHMLTAGLDYNYNTNHFYGYDATVFTNLNKSNTKQFLSKIGGHVGVKSFIKDSASFNYDADLRYYNLSNNYNSSENNVVLNGNLQQYYSTELIKMNIGIDYNNFKNATTITNSTIIKLHPHIISKGEKYQVNAGLGIFIDAGTKTKFYFKPIAEARYSLVKEILIPYIGVTGDVKRNSFNTITEENPFMISNVPLANSNQKPKTYIGIRGVFSSKIAFNVAASIGKIERMPLFVTDPVITSNNRFTSVYDTLQITNLGGEISYQDNEKIRLVLKGDYFIYKTNSELKAWNLPSYKFSINGEYNIKDKLIGKVDVFLISKRFGKTYTPREGKTINTSGIYSIELKGIADINLGLEYRYTARLSAFINFNNIATSRYSRWYSYPSQRFNVLGGLAYSF